MATLTLPDSRVLEYELTGPDDGPVLVFHHGTPGSDRPLGVLERAVHDHGLRLLTPARPGYASSARRAGRTVADMADDVAALLDAVGVDQCFTAGWSGGGPHALATAARLPDRVRGALVIAGVAPHDAQDLDFLAGMGEPNIEEFGAAADSEDALRTLLGQDAEALKTIDAAGLLKSLAGLIPDVDTAVLEAGLAVDLARDFAHAVGHGIDGWIDDDRAFVAPWGIDVADVRVPTFLWQGSDDLMVPAAHGHWLAEHVLGIRAHFVDGEGHISILAAQAGAMLGELTRG